MSIPQKEIRHAELGTKWEQDWQCQPNAAAMYVRQGSIVIALQSVLSAILFSSVVR
jgi:hypothetical protein